VLPYVSLALTYRQLLAEYLPICRAAPATIDWKDVLRYIVKAGSLTPRFVPLGMTIVANRAECGNNSIDILPIIKMQQEDPEFTCHFIRDFTGVNVAKDSMIWHDDDVDVYFDVDTRSLQSFIQHDNYLWKDDIRT
jgi:hypothetical protein